MKKTTKAKKSSPAKKSQRGTVEQRLSYLEQALDMLSCDVLGYTSGMAVLLGRLSTLESKVVSLESRLQYHYTPHAPHTQTLPTPFPLYTVTCSGNWDKGTWVTPSPQT